MIRLWGSHFVITIFFGLLVHLKSSRQLKFPTQLGTFINHFLNNINSDDRHLFTINKGIRQYQQRYTTISTARIDNYSLSIKVYDNINSDDRQLFTINKGIRQYQQRG